MGFRTCINPRQRCPDFKVIPTRIPGVSIRAAIWLLYFLYLNIGVIVCASPFCSLSILALFAIRNKYNKKHYIIIIFDNFALYLHYE